jgi:hypothetical protein
MLTVHHVLLPLPQVRASKSQSPNPASLPADAPFMSAINPHPFASVVRVEVYGSHVSVDS